MSRAQALGCLCVLVFAAGCRQPEGASLPLRWIETMSEQRLRPDEIFAVDPVLELDFTSAESPTGAVLEGAEILGQGGPEGIVLRPREGNPRLRLQRRFTADEAGVVEVSLGGLERGRLSLTWSEGEEPIGRRELDRLWAQGVAGDRFRFDLSGALPQGRPVDLALELTNAPGELVSLRRVVVGRPTLTPDRLEELAAHPWKATLADDLRSVLVAPASGDLARRLRVPERGKLRFGVGVLGAVGPVARFSAHVRAPGRPEEELWFERVEGGGEARWRDVELDLGAWAAQEVEVLLRAHTDRDELVPPLSLWAHPEVRSEQATTAERPNIVLIVVDTLRADRLSLYGYERRTTPNLDAWATRRGTVFRNVIAPSGWTLPSHFSLFTGLDAIRHPANFDTFAARTEQFELLAERLRAAGYFCQAITGGGFVHPLYGFAQGFDSYVTWPAARDRDEELSTHIARAIGWLEARRSEPFFLFFHTFEVHTPNRARQPFFSAFSALPAGFEAVSEGAGATPAEGFVGHSTWRLASPGGGASLPLPAELGELPSDLYDSAVAFTDLHLNDLLRALERGGLGERTAVVVTSDHGEALGEDGRASHGHLYESNLRVPLIVSLPLPASRPQEIEAQARLIDLFPTLLDLAGLEGARGIDARSLWGWIDGTERPVARAAWSYAALTGDGLALSDGRGHKLEWRDTVWRPAAGKVRFTDVVGIGEGRPADGERSRELSRRLETVARTYFAARAAGLHVELANRGTGRARIRLTSALIQPPSVKSPDLEPPYLAWRNMGELELELAAGSSVRLVFQQIPGDDISMTARSAWVGCGEEAIRELHAPVADLQAGRSSRMSDPCGREEVIEARIGWLGRLPTGASEVLDPALAAELRALGYLK